MKGLFISGRWYDTVAMNNFGRFALNLRLGYGQN